MFLEFLNIFFFFFHTAIMLFNCFGWIWKKTRRLNLVTLLLTAGSWFILGIWFGWGYCLCSVTCETVTLGFAVNGAAMVDDVSTCTS